MSMEAYALCAGAMPGVAEWQAAIHENGFDPKLDAAAYRRPRKGICPRPGGAARPGFECQIIPLSDLTDTHTDIDFGGP